MAALAATGAFAQVSIVGGIDAGYKVVTHSGNPTAEWSGVGGNNVMTSAIIFKGVEDIGGGVKGSFLYEIDPTVDRNTALNQSAVGAGGGQNFSGASAVNSEIYVGLSGAFGDIKFGTPNSPGLIAMLTSQPFGTAMGGGVNGGYGRLGTQATSGLNQYVGGPLATGRIIRSEKAAVYTTPAFSGISAQLEYSGKNANGSYASNDNGLLGLAVSYNQGPLNLMYYNGKASAGGVAAAGTPALLYGAVSANKLEANNSVTWNIFGANYTFGSTTLMGGYTTTKTDGTYVLSATNASNREESSSWNLAFKQVYGAWDFLGNYAVRTTKLNSVEAGLGLVAVPGFADQSTQLALGVNYNFSKRTSVYVRYEALSGLNGAATSAAGLAALGGVGGAPTFVDAKQTTTVAGVKVLF